jgi:hypothetical protein
MLRIFGLSLLITVTTEQLFTFAADLHDRHDLLSFSAGEMISTFF